MYKKYRFISVCAGRTGSKTVFAVDQTAVADRTSAPHNLVSCYTNGLLMDLYLYDKLICFMHHKLH